MRKNRGYTLLELVFVMALLTMFGVTAITLVIAGSKAYETIDRSRNDNAEVRIAASYINMKIRQNDLAGYIRIEPSQTGEGDAIVIEEHAGKSVYETWIYYDAGILREGYVKQGDPVRNETSFTIAVIDGLNIAYDKNAQTIAFRVWRNRNGQEIGRDSIVYLRTGL